MRKSVKLIVLMAFPMVLSSWDIAECAQRKLLSFAATQTSSAVYPYMVSMGKVINKALPDVNVTVMETGGSKDNLARLIKGQVDFGQITQDVGYMCYHGVYDYEGKPFKKLRYFLMSANAHQNFMVRKDSGIKKIEDLDGKKFHPGMRGSSTEMNCELALSVLGIKPKYYRGGSADAIEALKNGDIVGQVKSSFGDSLDSASMEVNLFIPLVFLSFEEVQRKKISEKLPYLPWAKQPEGVIKNHPGFWVYEQVMAFATTSDLPEDLVYRITKALFEGAEEQRQAFPTIKNLDLFKQTLETATAPLHIGTIKYFRELGYRIPDKLLPPEAK